MAYGFVITRGDANEKLEDRLIEAVAEIRVEQELSKKTKFAIRFEEDICEGQPTALSARSLRPGEVLAVLVPDEQEASLCLVRGPITKLKSSSVLGGPGSWLEVHGEDRRVEMERESVSAVWTGSATDIASAILALHRFPADVKASDAVQFDTATRTLNQSSPDLKAIEDLGRLLGYEFWFTYAVAGAGTGYRITETATFKPSPDYGQAGGAGGLAGAVGATIDMLAGPGAKTLRLNVADGQCRNLSAFDLDVDVERATAAVIEGVDDRSGEADDDQPADERPAVDPDAQATLAQFSGVTRTINQPGAGSAADRSSETRATLSDEGWFVTATASTSAFLLPGVLQPHEIVEVEGSGFAHSGKYQVSKAIHVINGWGHLMDLTLRRNALPEAAYG